MGPFLFRGKDSQDLSESTVSTMDSVNRRLLHVESEKEIINHQK